MWIVLTFLACLSGSDPRECREVRIPWQGTVMQCLVQGQARIARWEREHPGYRRTGPVSLCDERRS